MNQEKVDKLLTKGDRLNDMQEALDIAYTPISQLRNSGGVSPYMQIVALAKYAYALEGKNAWALCRLCHKAAEQSESYARDLAKVLPGLGEQAIRNRRNAWAFRLAVDSVVPLVVSQDRLGAACEKGFSFFAEAWAYVGREYDPITLFDFIEQADTIKGMRTALHNVYGDTEPAERVIPQTERALRVFVGMLETLRAPDSVRDAANRLMAEITAWRENAL